MVFLCAVLGIFLASSGGCAEQRVQQYGARLTPHAGMDIGFGYTIRSILGIVPIALSPNIAASALATRI
jgi:hypothetical protein